MEVIEHLDPDRIPALERVVLREAAPGIVVVTTPNAEYNQHFATLEPGAMRHRGPPFRVDPRRVPRLGAGSRQEPRLPGPVPAGRPGTPGRTARPPSWPSSSRGSRDQLSNAELNNLELAVPELSLVVLVGVTGSGKSTFARAHFKPTEVISSDFCRGLVADDENDQSATPDAFELLHYIAGKRLAAGRLTVIDATNVQPEGRRQLVALAREHDVLPVAIVLDLPEKLCAERNASRPDRDFGPHVLRRQRGQLRRGLRGLACARGSAPSTCCAPPRRSTRAAITRTRLYSDLQARGRPVQRGRRRARLPRRARAAAGDAGVRAGA